MKRLLKFIVIISAIAESVMIATPAQASQQGRIFKDLSGGIFVYGLQPHQAVQAAKDEMSTQTIAANACELLIIRDAVAEILIERTLIDSSQLPVQMLPPCKDGQLAEPRPLPFRTSAGIVALPNYRVIVMLFPT